MDDERIRLSRFDALAMAALGVFFRAGDSWLPLGLHLLGAVATALVLIAAADLKTGPAVLWAVVGWTLIWLGFRARRLLKKRPLDEAVDR
ncbi:MAG: hypothetical protein GX444_09600, partial [Myxococcales bacterium]|nr:hypothetical protein [Myxococcales bacterium]